MVNDMKVGFLYFLSIFFLSSAYSYAQEIQCVKEKADDVCTQSQPVQARADAYINFMNKGSPYTASQFLKDKDFEDFYKDNDDYQRLRIQAYALSDLEKLFHQKWNEKNFNKLNKALTIRIKEKNILSEMGIGPEPEKVLVWLEKYMPQYGSEKQEIVKKAIREWNVVFGNTDLKEFTNKNGIEHAITRQQWTGMELLKRNAIINELIATDRAFRIYIDVDEAEASVVLSTAEIQAMVDKALKSGTLNAGQISALTETDIKPEMQLSLLGKMFDGSNNVFNSVEMAKINSQSDVTGAYLVLPKDSSRISMMLSNAVANEIKGTEAGDYALEYGALNIKIGTVRDAYSSLEDDGSITVDRELIGRFLQYKGYSADSLVSGPQSTHRLKELAMYISPIAVYEGMRRKQEKYAKTNKIYKAHTQEDEIEASSMEAMYFIERMGKDPEFEAMFRDSKNYLAYSAKTAANANMYSQGQEVFEMSVRQANSGLPSLSSSSSELVYRIEMELERRAAVSDSEDMCYINERKARTYSPQEIISNIQSIKTKTLVKIKEDISSGKMYSYYSESEALLKQGFLGGKI